MKEGDILKRHSDGKTFVVKTIKKDEVVLEAEDKLSQVLTDKDGIKMDFEKQKE